ncbi:meso-butanediol dehydrogenase / (S,S)-butanediol dehydrogenase / diacetyl reductase [Noviherbaspirillum humi]|uniref:Meso-butanediol dehydrogenase / (S,S)-butanediol dehydrogenase / diacetyl reductase n=1 Tax=Noviherbaspirillum humi TaxID=1688639 RepID=A0A239L7I8_9BURK|nr:SDR family oxidoreductase [Noviherbaspirillum humi]SNT25494.1 meso-butanediol dehydrogenase / (S,S)-butanediol dehydrogenase / diacetyl reductase [Noviherbaspirillum humi]
MDRFRDKVVIVTGAGSGIGEATARRFAAEGASVVLAGRTADKLERVARSLPAERALVCATDVARLDQVERMMQATLQRFGRLDVLVNNAGVAPEGYITDASVDDWKEVMAVDLDGVFYCCRCAIPELKKTRGSIINVSSVSGLGGDWRLSFYNAAKGAVTNFTRALAMDHGIDGIRVNAVCPSLTRTPLTEDMYREPELMAKFNERIPMGRGAEPEEVADVIAFLASHDARFVNGVNLPIDGGLTASNGQPPMS